MNFDFLDPEKSYRATVYYDDETVETRTQVGSKQVRINADHQQSFELNASGGIAIHIQPL